MIRRFLSSAAIAVLAHTATARDIDPKIEFNREVRPILSDKCFFCHGPDEKHRKAGLRLDAEKDARAAETFVPGKPEESTLIHLVTTTKKSERMPPAKSGKTLTPADIDILRR